MPNYKNGVILLNMGGPESLDDVQSFLYNLFSDRQIIRLGPALLQKYLAKIIARRRTPKSKETYSQIGGGSPLKEITLNQAKDLQQALVKDGDFCVSVAMRYWPPFASEAIQSLLDQGVQHITALSLYPHYSKATTGSSLSRLRQDLQRIAPNIPFTVIDHWPTQKSYIRAWAGNIKKGLDTFNTEEVEVVYSAHGLPTSFIRAGDPYLEHLKQSIKEIEKITKRAGKLCYQSQTGPVEWLSPSTSQMLEDLAQKDCKNILMVPISFVSDHVETLYEIDILYRNRSAQLGMRLRQCESLNTNPIFIQGLKELVLQEQDGIGG